MSVLKSMIAGIILVTLYTGTTYAENNRGYMQPKHVKKRPHYDHSNKAARMRCERYGEHSEWQRRSWRHYPKGEKR